jgi:hypothetical protein
MHIENNHADFQIYIYATTLLKMSLLALKCFANPIESTSHRNQNDRIICFSDSFMSFDACKRTIFPQYLRQICGEVYFCIYFLLCIQVQYTVQYMFVLLHCNKTYNSIFVSFKLKSALSKPPYNEVKGRCNVV